MEKPRAMSKTGCCVVDCHNAYYNTDSSTKFYCFPGKWYETERRQIWIRSVRRLGEKRELWQPKTHDRICSAHFIGNEKSNNPRSPAYNPTIFPKYRSGNSLDINSRENRFKRLLNRSTAKSDCSKVVQLIHIDEHVSNEPLAALELELEAEPEMKIDFSCQTDATFVDDHEEADFFCFESTFVTNSCEVAVQVNIPSTQAIKLLLQKQDKCVGNDDSIECNGFHGYKSLKTDQELNCVAGLYFDRFMLLLSFINTVHGNSKLSTENRLLLFLMKMELGISYCTLSVFFQLHYTTCSRIFLSVLNELVQKARNFVFWPSRNVIDSTMPKAFKLNYPTCRAVIDCTEIKIQQPNKVDQRIHTYSQYKGTFTAKCLIGIAPTGFISFISKCYGGRSTDEFITNDCGFLELLEAGDTILADKGFPGIKCKDNVVLVLPLFVHEGRLTYEEIEETYTVASVRIHVERSIQRIKTYNILQNVPYNVVPYLDDIVYMCCVLANLQPPTIKDNNEE